MQYNTSKPGTIGLYSLFHERNKQNLTTPNRYHTHVIINCKLTLLLRTKFCSVPWTSTVKTAPVTVKTTYSRNTFYCKKIQTSSCSPIIRLFILNTDKFSRNNLLKSSLLKRCCKKGQHQKA